MQYLFFDCEFSSSKESIKLCSFGYVLTDENFKIIKSDDLIINPNFPFDKYVLDHVLYYDESYYLKGEKFNYYYPLIKKLMSESLCIGFGLKGDLKALKDELKRYKLKAFKFNFYDLKHLTDNLKTKDNPHISLSKASILLNCQRQGHKHRSLEDAMITYEIMQKLLLKDNLNLNTFFLKSENKFFINESDENKDFNKEVKPLKTESQVFKSYVKMLKEKKRSKDLKVGFSVVLENHYPKLMLSFLKGMEKKHLSYSAHLDDLAYYVTYETKDLSCPKLKPLQEKINAGLNCKIITLDEFKTLINYQEVDLEKLFLKIKFKVNFHKNKLYYHKVLKKKLKKAKEKRD